MEVLQVRRGFCFLLLSASLQAFTHPRFGPRLTCDGCLASTSSSTAASNSSGDLADAETDEPRFQINPKLNKKHSVRLSPSKKLTPKKHGLFGSPTKSRKCKASTSSDDIPDLTMSGGLGPRAGLEYNPVRVASDATAAMKDPFVTGNLGDLNDNFRTLDPSATGDLGDLNDGFQTLERSDGPQYDAARAGGSAALDSFVNGDLDEDSDGNIDPTLLFAGRPHRPAVGQSRKQAADSTDDEKTPSRITISAAAESAPEDDRYNADESQMLDEARELQPKKRGRPRKVPKITEPMESLGCTRGQEKRKNGGDEAVVKTRGRSAKVVKAREVVEKKRAVGTARAATLRRKSRKQGVGKGKGAHGGGVGRGGEAEDDGAEVFIPAGEAGDLREYEVCY
jgi:hypothetical protein